MSTVCPVCLDGEETIYHALVLCRFAAQCWRQVLTDFRTDEVESFREWFLQVIDSCSLVKRGEVAIGSWAIWKARNELV